MEALDSFKSAESFFEKPLTDLFHLRVKADITEEMSEILTPGALQFIEELEKYFGDRRQTLLSERSAHVYSLKLEPESFLTSVRRQSSLKADVRHRLLRHSQDGGRCSVVPLRDLQMSVDEIKVDGESASAALFDFGLFYFHNAHSLMALGNTVIFHLSRVEGNESKFWNDVFEFAQESLGVRHRAIRAVNDAELRSYQN
jgi:malate synthase